MALFSGDACAQALSSDQPAAAASGIASTSQDDPTAVTPAGRAESGGDDIVVIGSQIRGANTTGALPVSLVSTAEIAATGAVSANELYRSIPQAGAVTFGNPTGAGQNGARGDVSTVSLRGLGLGTTLVLLNGRRVVAHPTTTAVDGAPQQSYNVNAIPVNGIERLEILRDGAAALYGSDAIAGVVNTVLAKDLKGGSFEVQHGFAEGTNLKETTVNGSYGSDFAGGRGHFSVLGTFYARSAQHYGDQDYTATQDLRSVFTDPAFRENIALDTRQANSVWGQFHAPASAGVVRRNGVALTSAAGVFHLQPTTSAGCQSPSATPGVCFDDGILASAADRNLRFDAWRTFPNSSVTPRARRANVFLFSNYDLTDSLELFTESSYYYAKTRAFDMPAVLSSTFNVTVAANAYWNPFGPVGSPNRLSGLNIPASGIPLQITSYAPLEPGPRQIDVTNRQFRVLAGLRGNWGDFNWESAALYSEATVRDVSDAISLTLFQAAVNGVTASAYNPFGGGNPADPSTGDATLNPTSSWKSFMVKGKRFNKSSLALGDFKISNARLLSLWAGDIGIATGVELRRETYLDDRDPRLDGTIRFTDAVTGAVNPSDFANASQRMDVRGSRRVFSAFGELAIPLVSPEMNIPLVRKIDVQLAGRYERFSDVGDVAKPKVAAFWDVFEGLRLRGSYSGGFRAPNLEVLNIPAATLTSNGNLDYVQCEADLRARRITSFSQCTRTFTMQASISGNRNVKPETSDAVSFGVVLQPAFIPSSLGRFTFTVDRFRIKQNNVVSALGNANLLALDYLARVQGGTTDAVTRLPVTADDVAIFAGTGIAPAGQPTLLTTQYDNLQPLTVDGVDFAVTYVSPRTEIGRFNASATASKLIRYLQDPLLPQQTLLEAQAQGIINSGFIVGGSQELSGLNTRPKWRATGTITWTLDDLQVGSFIQYIGSVKQTALLDAANTMFTVKAQTTVNLYAQYAFRGSLEGLKLTVGARNIFDQDPPIAPGGYLAGLYQPQARYWYTSVGFKF